MKGVAYQQNYEPNGNVAADAGYTDPLADGDLCRRDIPILKQIYTNVLRVYAIDPTANHDDCMEQLADADIYIVADMAEPGTSIMSNDPAWDVDLYRRYTGVIDSLSKYKNVIGFFAGNENVHMDNQTAAAAFVKAAVRDTKGYIRSQGYRSTLGVGYATADVPTRNQLAEYFACEVGNSGNQTTIDFWGYNVYSWCGQSSYQESQYGERLDYFSSYPVPVFFAEYGCNQDLPDGPTSRPFTEVEVLYGNMTDVFSGGIVYEYFMNEANEYGLVSIDGDSVSPYPDFTSLRDQLGSISPTITQRSEYTPANSAPACPTTDADWEPQSSPLPPVPNPQACACVVQDLECNIDSTDAESYGSIFNFICDPATGNFCEGIAANASSGDYGTISGCAPKDQLAWVANQYYLGNDRDSSACDFSGAATVQEATVATGCQSFIDAIGTAGTGAISSPTGRGTDDVGTATAGPESSSSRGVGAPGVSTPAMFSINGGVLLGVYIAIAIVSMVGMVAL